MSFRTGFISFLIRPSSYTTFYLIKIEKPSVENLLYLQILGSCCQSLHERAETVPTWQVQYAIL